MKKICTLVLFLACCCGHTFAQTYTPTPENLAARREFQDMKFGLFIHWGPYSVLGQGEWVMHNRNIHTDDYDGLIRAFNPVDFDAKEWVAAAKNAGVQYITFTSRHHDSFSNWDTGQSDWKITNTPYGRDVLKQLADECHRQGIKLFLYYSLLDWYRTDYQYQTGRTGKGTGRTEKGDWDNYIRFMKAQLTELLTNYGEISGIWLDGHWDQTEGDHDKSQNAKVDWRYDELYTLIHQLQPGCLIGNNHHIQPFPGEDFQMFERDLPGENKAGLSGQAISPLPLETCQTINGAWGYNITDRNYKSEKELIHYLVNAAGKNANFLLNVGPKPNGEIQQEFTDRLAAIGKWLRQYGESYYGTRGNVIPTQSWGTMTSKGNTRYVHILNKPEQENYIFIPAWREKIASAQLFADKRPVRFKQQPEGTFIFLDGIALDEIDTVIRLNIR